MATNQTASLIATNANDIRDIKPPVDIPNYWWVLWVALGAVVVVTLLLLLWRQLHRRMTRTSIVPPVPAHVRAKKRLQEALAYIAQPKPFCIMVSDTVRTYLEERFTFRAPERTTEEFLHELQDTDLLAAEQKEKLGEFLEQCDLVKFAKYEPGETELKNLHNSAMRLVEETEEGKSGNRPPSPGYGAAGESKKAETGMNKAEGGNKPVSQTQGDSQSPIADSQAEADSQSESVNRKAEIKNSP